jgi:hypothetical protein
MTSLPRPIQQMLLEHAELRNLFHDDTLTSDQYEKMCNLANHLADYYAAAKFHEMLYETEDNWLKRYKD